MRTKLYTKNKQKKTFVFYKEEVKEKREEKKNVHQSHIVVPSQTCILAPIRSRRAIPNAIMEVDV